MKYWNPVRNLLLSGLLALFLGLLGQRLYTLPGWFPGAMVLGVVWGSGLGFWQGKKNGVLPSLCFLCGLVISAGLCYRIFLQYVGAGFTGTLLVGIAQGVGFLFTARSQDSFYGPLGVSAVIASLLTLLLYRDVRLILPAAVTMVLNLDGFRVMGLYRSHHMGKSGHITQRDPGLFRSSMGLFAIGLTVLLGLAILLYLSGLGAFTLLKQLWGLLWEPLRQAASRVDALLEALWLWFLSHFHQIGPEQGVHTGEIKAHYHFGLPENSYAIAWLPLAGLAAMLATIGFAAVRFVRKKTVQKPCDYVDEVEFLERPRLSLRNWLRRRRSQKITDFTDNNLKIRFIFQQLLREKLRTDAAALSRTPNELADGESPLELQLAGIYNRIRYGGKRATDQEVLWAAKYLEETKQKRGYPPWK